MLILVNGCLGVGKTTMGDALNNKLSNSSFFDGDAFLANTDTNIHESNHFIKWTQIIYHNVSFHMQKFNAQNFVISYVWENQTQITDFIAYFRKVLQFFFFTFLF